MLGKGSSSAEWGLRQIAQVGSTATLAPFMLDMLDLCVCSREDKSW